MTPDTKHSQILNNYCTSIEIISVLFDCDMESFLSTLSAKPYIFKIIFILSSGIAVAPDLMPHVLGRGLPSLVGAPSTIGVVDLLHPNLHAQSSPSVLLGAPARVGNSVKPSCIPFWESASGPQLLPTLGHHNFSFNLISLLLGWGSFTNIMLFF